MRRLPKVPSARMVATGQGISGGDGRDHRVPAAMIKRDTRPTDRWTGQLRRLAPEPRSVRSVAADKSITTAFHRLRDL